MSEYVTISVKDIEALMLAAACVRGVYAAIDSHRQDAAVTRCRGDVEMAISNASKSISAARRVKDPMEDELPTVSEAEIMATFSPTYDGEPYALDPRSLMAVSMLRKRLIVMGHMTGTIHWGDKTTENRGGDRVVWKLSEKGERLI